MLGFKLCREGNRNTAQRSQQFHLNFTSRGRTHDAWWGLKQERGRGCAQASVHLHTCVHLCTDHTLVLGYIYGYIHVYAILMCAHIIVVYLYAHVYPCTGHTYVHLYACVHAHQCLCQCAHSVSLCTSYVCLCMVLSMWCWYLLTYNHPHHHTLQSALSWQVTHGGGGRATTQAHVRTSKCGRP